MATKAITTTTFPVLSLSDIDMFTQPFAAFYTITPSVAAAVMEHRNTTNRKMRENKLAQLRQDLSSGRMALNGESIIFSNIGSLLDGQHRLIECARTGVSFVSLVAFGIDPETQITVDQGISRSLSDTLAMGGVAYATHAVAAARQVLAYRKGTKENFGRPHDNSQAEVMAFIDDTPEVISKTAWAGRLGAHMKGVTTVSVLATCRMILEPVYGDEAVYYLERVAVGDDVKVDDPAFQARRRLETVKSRAIMVAAEIIMRGAIAHMEGRKLSRINVDGRLPALPKRRVVP